MSDFDPETMFSYCPPEEIRVARTIHKCCECGEEILPGKRYIHFRGICQGKWQVYDMCSKCKEDWGMIIDWEWEEYITYTELAYSIERGIDDRLIEKDDPLIRRWILIIEQRKKEFEQKLKKDSCPLQCLA